MRVLYRPIMEGLDRKVGRTLLAALAAMLLAAPAFGRGSEIHAAVRAQDAAKVKALLAADKALIKAEEPEGSGLTPLHVAAGINSAEMIKLLVANKADINARTRKGFTPLHVAAYADADAAVKALVAAKAKTQEKANDGLTPLQVAVKRNAEAAVKALTEAKVAYSDRSLDARVKEGEKAREDGDLERAFEIYSRLRRDNPENKDILFGYGTVCVSMNEYGKAQTAFQAILRKDPGNDRARLELANAYMATKEYPAAKREFETVLRTSSRLTPNVRAGIEKGLALIRQQSKKWYLSGRVDVGHTDDSNVNVGPNSRTIGIEPIVFGAQTMTTLTVDEGTLPKESEGWFGSVAAFTAYDGGEQGKWMTTLDAAYYENVLESGFASNESAFAQATLGARFAAEKSMFRIPFRFARVEKGGEPLMNMFAVVPSYQMLRGEGMNTLLSTDFTVESRKWEELSDRDSVYFMISERAQRRLGTRGGSAGAATSLFHDNSDADIYRNTGVALSLDGSAKMPLNFTLYGRARYTHAEYAEKEPLAPETRKDNQIDFAAGLNWMWQSFGLDLNYSMTDNSSTFDLYEYERDVLTLSSFYAF